MLLRQRHMSDGIEFKWQRAIFAPHDARTSKRSAWRNFKRVQASLQRGGLLRIVQHGLRDFKYGAAFMQKRQIARDELVKRVGLQALIKHAIKYGGLQGAHPEVAHLRLDGVHRGLCSGAL